MLETLLVTGFGPFGPHATNVSEQAAARLDGLELDGFVIRALQLPVAFERAVALLEEALETERPAAVLATGIHRDPAGFRIELAARNERDDPLPGVDGVQVRGGTIEDGGPPMVFSTLPVGAIKRALEEEGLAAELSDDAGRFLCNAVFYWLARRVPQVGFLHVPPAPDGLEAVTRGVRAAARATAERLAAQRVEASA